MRVIHVLDHSLPRVTPYVAHTMAILEAQRAEGWETFHLTGPNHGPDPATEEDVDGWHFHRSPPPGGILEGLPGIGALEFIGEIAHRLERLARRVRPHVLHAHSPVLNALPALRVGRRLRIPVVYDLRPQRELPASVPSGRRMPLRLASMIETWVLNRADAVTTACAATRTNVLLRGVPPAKVTLIACAADYADGQTAGDGARAGVRIDPANGYVRVYAHVIGVA